LTREKSKGTRLKVFSGREARLNRAIFEILAKESPQPLKQLYKKINKQKGLEETYYASLTKRLRCLKEAGYIAETKQKHPSPTIYELRTKAYLAMFLEENSMQDIIEQVTDTQSALILMALLNAVTQEKA
jgi:5'-deoxynucleotidase YfbR-like HD superfamily hydrolase